MRRENVEKAIFRFPKNSDNLEHRVCRVTPHYGTPPPGSCSHRQTGSFDDGGIAILLAVPAMVAVAFDIGLLLRLEFSVSSEA